MHAGANSQLGIGRAAACQFAANGARAIYLCDHDSTHLDEHKSEIGRLWPAVAVHTRKLDAADEAAVREVISDAVSQHGRLDVFFANAGTMGPHTSFRVVEAAVFMETMRVNALR